MAQEIRREYHPERASPPKTALPSPPETQLISQPLSSLFPMNISSRNGNTSSTNQACAACKYRRRKCAPDCILAPYFPHDRQPQFLNAHKLFGVRNITKIIEHLDPHDRDQAMRTIIYQSDMRANDPVGGCYRYIQELNAQIEYYRAELELVLRQLAIFRAQAAHHHYNATANVNINGDQVINADLLNLYHYLQQVPTQEQYIIVQENNNSHNNNNGALQQDVNTWAMQDSMSLSSLSLQSKNGSGYVGDEYDHKSMLDIHSDERNELRFEPEDLVERSDEAILFKIDNAVVKAEADHCIQQAQDHDLKGAATLFTLTNCTS